MYEVGNLGPGLRQTQKYDGLKPVDCELSSIEILFVLF